ncbi:SdrD B-like domain-containing protein, partial [Yoonia sp. 2307UL14-13]|uniref:SdrD B-like domain-containing protein n=1 Tax=Yoonia sp. 2307UL14-13 TaxID=3126506 RepID=UPI0030A5384C
MTYQNYRWFAFSENDLLAGRPRDHSISVGDVFDMPARADFELSVRDDDRKLSGDKCNDKSTDHDQKAFVNGHAIPGRDMYVEQVFILCGSDGEYYRLAEIEIEGYHAPGRGDDFFSFVGAVPPAGTELVIVDVHDVNGSGIPYDDFMDRPAVDPKNNAPEFDNLPGNGVIEIAENSDDVIDIDATDDDGDAITYSIVPGADSDAFMIDPESGALSFVTPPDFENPTDVFRQDNTYDVTVRADDGKGGVTEKTLWVKVRNVDEATDPVCIVIEAETMDLSGFRIRHGDNASDGGLVRLEHFGGKGEISTDFNGAAGAYDLSLFVQDESDGQSEISILVNGEIVGTAVLDADSDGRGSDDGRFSEITFPDIALAPGDRVAIQAAGDGHEYVRIDRIELCQDGQICPDGFSLLDFEGVAAGTVVSDQFAGVTITAQRDRDNTDANDAMLFDSANPTGGDTDLAFADQGNLLIISEDNDSSDPDDALGGMITFDFDAPSDLHNIKIFDIEQEGGTITLTLASGETRIIPIPATGDNSEQTIALDAADVTQMEIALVSSGAIDDLCWAPGAAPDVGALTGRVFMDADDDGVDTDEMGVAGVPVTLVDADGNDVATVTTGADGSYVFADVVPGSYSVRFPTVTDDGKVLVDQDAGDDDAVDSDADPATGLTAPITVVAGETTEDVDAGLADPGTASLGGRLFADSDDDAIDNGNGDEAGIGGQTVILQDGDGNVIAEQVTGDDGSYLFEDLAAGDYVVVFPTDVDGQGLVAQDQGGDETADSDADPTTGATAVIPVAIGDAIRDVDAGITAPAAGAITGVLFMDADKSDTQSDGDMPVAGAVVTLLQGGVTVAQTETGADGSYSFDGLAPGDDYVVQFGNPTDKVFAGQDAGDDDTIDSDADATGQTGPITVVAGATTEDVDAGLVDPGTASLAGRIFMDGDDDGVDDAEMGVAGVPVTLQDADGNDVATTTTGADGSYVFEDLDAGDYVVVFPTTTADGKVLVAQDQGDDDAVDSDADPTTGATAPISVGVGDAITDVDAGVSDPGTASLGGRVFVDSDDDSIDNNNGDEAAVAGVLVTLQDGDGNEVATTTTDDDGNYLFEDLDAGDYVVVFPTDVDGLTLVDQDAGDDDSADSDADQGTGATAVIPLAIGEDIRDVDAGLEDPGTASLGGRVFVDSDDDSIDNNNGDEAALAGVPVTLFDADGNEIATTTTDDEGNYLFEDLDAGDYVVGFPPTFNDLILVDQDAGDDDTADSDAGADGRTAPISLGIGADIRDVDAGLEAPAPDVGALTGRVFMDADDDGVDTDEMGVAGVPVTLVDADGN